MRVLLEEEGGAGRGSVVVVRCHQDAVALVRMEDVWTNMDTHVVLLLAGGWEGCGLLHHHECQRNTPLVKYTPLSAPLLVSMHATYTPLAVSSAKKASSWSTARSAGAEGNWCIDAPHLFNSRDDAMTLCQPKQCVRCVNPPHHPPTTWHQPTPPPGTYFTSTLRRTSAKFTPWVSFSSRNRAYTGSNAATSASL